MITGLFGGSLNKKEPPLKGVNGISSRS